MNNVSPGPSAALPLNVILADKNTYMRAIVLVLAVAGLISPAYTVTALGQSGSASVTEVLGWAWLLPLVVVAGLLFPAFSPVSRYSSLVDIAVLAMTAIISLFLVAKFLEAKSEIDNLVGFAGASSGRGRQMASIDLEFGTYVIFAATGVCILLVLRHVWQWKSLKS